MGSSKSGTKTKIQQHYMSMHIGICAYGRNMRLLQIKFGGKEAWRGNLLANADFIIDKTDLFGGDTKEGGVKGKVSWLNGNPNQTLPWRLAYRLGRTVSTVPGFRGLASIFLTGLVDSETSTDAETSFYQTANNPYLKEISVRVRRPSEGLNPSIALIRLPDDPDGNEQYASNAAHIVFEGMTNTDWGMGESLGAFDIGSFEACAQLFYDEGLGLNILWNRTTTIEAFIKEVLDHVKAAVFVNPTTGKHTMKALRDDYDVALIPEINPDNAMMSSFKTKSWGDITSEIVVTWTNPYSGETETVSAQDLAAISFQGGISSEPRNFYGIGSQDTALSLAERELAAVAYPYASCEAEVTREFWQQTAYEVVKLSWPEHGVVSAIFRVMAVTRGSTSRTLRLSLTEDVFGLEKSAYLAPVQTEWLNPSVDPSPVARYLLGTAPAYMTAISLGLTDISDLEYPDALSAVLTGQNTTDDINYELYTYTTSTTGAVVSKNLGTKEFQGSWTLTVAMTAQASSTVILPANFIGRVPEDGDFLFIGDVTDDASEIALIASKSGDTLTVRRGVLDTTPKAWPIGTPIWVVPAAGISGDATIRSAFEYVEYRLRTVTSKGKLALGAAPLIGLTVSERPHLPIRPADVKVGGTAFGTFNMGTGTSVVVSWKNRNRITEATQVFAWTDASVTVESGQSTRIQILKYSDRSVIATINSLTGESTTIPRASFGGELDTIIRVTSRRVGFGDPTLDSLQGHEIRVILT